MDLGVYMPTHGMLRVDEERNNYSLQPIDLTEVNPIAFAKEAEVRGFHSAWFPDHVVMGRTPGTNYPATESGKASYRSRPMMMDAIPVMSAVAVSTTDLKLATSVHIMPYRHPLVSAHQFAAVDFLSNGRLMVGVGIGWEEAEFTALNADYRNRGAVTEEGIEVMKAAWTNDFVEYSGEYFSVHEVSFDPKPTQKPRPPIYYGATTVVGARRAARVADGLYMAAFLDPFPSGNIRPAQDAVLREAERIDRDLSDFWWGTVASAHACAPGAPSSQNSRRPVLTGSACQILDELQHFADRGFEHVTCHLSIGSNSPEELYDQLAQWGEDIIPYAKEIAKKPIQ
ncbi:hypothetical protein CH306_26270 [Rhodococcus sp. 15-725-2-2b]|uniref:TIGR03619 family F420-dependent LLM class oxidoreductase n=1 Tax=unclassified Rhodococcus (in: high G+C Gram-positive bacteria) TaxID=192944 RepID=UPI000B9A6A26|nr:MULTISPECIES: TIGR03619 family F420-dependent LLM class oxidoreductase [unclassified Rhodococcus (in: high G+C Gram-positive bacteria)]OZC63606.1 hypothetical protein CH277_22390 [Rhodococcus sp. 06-469-3-2]OZD40771.1 hypothetical protein CH264_24075 [Rhodococcus sp. 06-1477-1A]OZE67121.1 hypothetical protein CH306_26270 [Rhodococcus sp. 15-725-2-2b]